MTGPWSDVAAAGDASGQRRGPPSVHRFPCRQCGAFQTYEPGTDQLRCPHCGAVTPIDSHSRRIEELDWHSHLELAADHRDVEETPSVKCDACGAEFSLAEGIHADRCPFCGSAVVTDTGTSRHLKPNAVLPFAITEAEAKARLRQWLNGLWFAPSDLKRYARQNGRLDGMYVPYWTFDTDTRSTYRGQRGTVYYETVWVTVRDQRGNTRRVQQQVARVRWTPVSGRVARAFDDVLVLASPTLPTSYTEALEPWDLHDLRGYAEEYLSGFRSEIYRIDLNQGFEIAKVKMAPIIRADIAADIGGDQQRIDHVNTTFEAITFKHVLLPIWLAAYRYRGKPYRFLVNGRTGQIQGERPYSWVKIAFAVLLAILLLLAVLLVVDRSDAITTGFDRGLDWLPGDGSAAWPRSF